MVRAGILSAIIGSLLAVTSAPAAEQPFNPTKERITTSTDRTPVDIEIIGSTSLLPDSHRLLPDLVMRLRLERAYVSLFLSEEQPGYEILSMGLDLETGLPASLYDAVALGPRFSEHIPGIPVLSPAELRRRNLLLRVQSDHHATRFEKFREFALMCRGEALGNELWAYERKQERCPRLLINKFRRIGQLRDDVWLEVNCDNDGGPTWARCSTNFPFDGFAIWLNFDRDLLPRWREVIGLADKFLKSKQYEGSSAR